MRALEIGSGHFVSLLVIEANPAISISALAGELRVDASRAVMIVDDLERRGFATRLASPSDRRARALFLTPAGRRFAEKLRKKALAYDAQFTAPLTDDERRQLIVLLTRLAGEG
jgi:DNA-binding MarR family transcriptional regulator